MGEPFRVLAAGCGGFTSSVYVAPSECQQQPTVVGLIMFRRPDGRRAVWRGFACDAHAQHLIAARPLRPRDRDILQRRRAARRTELAGDRWAGEREGPLARGAEADRLVERALAWIKRTERPSCGGRTSPLR